MTLTDQENNNTVEQTSTMPGQLSKPVTKVGEALQHVLVQARDQGRATCGVYECTQLLQVDPTDVMLCVLPECFQADVSLHMHFILLEAFCTENSVRVLKVDSASKLGSTMLLHDDPDVKAQRERSDLDYSCILVEYPQEEMSSEDQEVLLYHKMTCDIYPQPVVELPG